MNCLADWLQKLPTPTGIIAVTDARVRHLLQTCEHLNLMVPDKISVIGTDNEELARYLNSDANNSLILSSFGVHYPSLNRQLFDSLALPELWFSGGTSSRDSLFRILGSSGDRDGSFLSW